MKKRSKALVLSLAAAVFLVLLPLSGSLTAQAAEPATFSVKYFSDKGWRYQPGAEFQDDKGDGDLGHLRFNLKDGDSVVVYPGDQPGSNALDLSDYKLDNLTVHRNVDVVVKTNGIKDCYVLAGASCAVNGDVTNAYIYDSANCNFNNNVLDMTLYALDYPNRSSNIACLGTVGRFYVHNLATDSGTNVFYNVKTFGILMSNGTFQIPDDKCSSTPTEEYTSAMESASAPASSTTPAPAPAPVSSSNEYDEVPKTGDSLAFLWLFPVAAVLGIGSFALRKKSN